MKQSWVVGIVMLYIALQGLTMIVQSSTTGDASVWANFNSMYHVNLTQNVVVTALSAMWAPAAVVLAVFVTLLEVIFLRYPALFSGYYVWFWWVVCLPIAVGFIVSIVSIIRGVHAG